MCGFIQPHPPWNIPKELDGLYREAVIPEPVPRSRMPMDGNEPNPWFGDWDSREQKEAIRKAYYTAVSMVDMAVGKILDTLREKGLLDNTLIIFTSDHGEMLQDKGYYSKELAYEGSVRVPLLLRYPKRLAGGRKIGGFVDSFDLLPTCLDVCGLAYPDGELRGESLFRLAEKNDREFQFSSSGLGYRRWVMCRNDRYKYVFHYNGGYEELYDMRDDGGEEHNLAEEKEGRIRNTVCRLRREALLYEQECGPEGNIRNGDFVPVPYEPYHGSIRGKFHYWANFQMQKFYEGERAGRLIQEIRHASDNPEKSGVALTALFNAESWQKDFQARFREYTGRELTPEEIDLLFEKAAEEAME